MVRALLVIVCVLASGLANAQPLSLTNDGRVAVGTRMTYLRDPSGHITINNISGVLMLPVEGGHVNFGFDPVPYWFRMEVSNQSNVREWLLEVNFSPLDKVEIFVQQDSGRWHHQVAGDNYPIIHRDEMHRHPLFEFDIPPGESRTIFLRVETVSSVDVPAVFWTYRALARVSTRAQLFNGMFYGAMLLMTLYQLFLFFSVRDRITLYYVFTLIAMTNTMSFFQGYNFLFLHPSYPQFNDVFAILTGPFFIVMSTLLTRAFLNLRRFSVALDNLLLANMFVDLFFTLLMIIFFRQVSYKYHHLFILSHCFIACICAGYCLWRKYKPARYYLLAWVAPFLGGAAFTLSNLGVLAGVTNLNFASVMVGCVLQTLFISFALGDRWRTLEKQNQFAKELELRRNQEENERLETEVRLRTTEIKQQNLELEEVNNVKDKLFSVVSHDIRGPLNSLHLTLTLAKAGALSAEEFRHIASELDVRLIQTTEFIDNLLQWAKLQMHGETFDPECVELNLVVSEAVRLLEPECSRKGVRMINNVTNTLEAYADLNMMRSVVRNLLTNATKFTNNEGTITINAYRVDQRIIVSVADSGIGIAKQYADKIFTLSTVSTDGTQREKGTGLGLLLCKEFVEKNGGKIWFETETGVGTTFFFSVPLYMHELRMGASKHEGA